MTHCAMDHRDAGAHNIVDPGDFAGVVSADRPDWHSRCTKEKGSAANGAGCRRAHNRAAHRRDRDHVDRRNDATLQREIADGARRQLFPVRRARFASVVSPQHTACLARRSCGSELHERRDLRSECPAHLRCGRDRKAVATELAFVTRPQKRTLLPSTCASVLASCGDRRDVGRPGPEQGRVGVRYALTLGRGVIASAVHLSPVVSSRGSPRALIALMTRPR